MGYIRRKIEGGFEKDIINLADRHIFVTKSNRDDYLNSYNIPKEKTFILTRGYDEKAYEKRDIYVFKQEFPLFLSWSQRKTG